MNRSMKAIIVIAILVVSCGVAFAQSGDKILGTYRVLSIESKEASNVNIYKKGNTYEAQIVWIEKALDKNGKPRLDTKNPDPALRSVKGDKIIIIRGLKYDSKKDRWIDGKIYNPETGKVYDAMAEFESPTKLKMKGYLGMQALGRSFIWNKIK